MRYRFATLLFFLVLLLALSACATPAGPQQVQPSATPGSPGETMPTPGNQSPNLFGPVQDALINQYHLAPEQIQVQSIEPVEWRDSCLGAAKPGEMCAQVITPGFLIKINTPTGSLEIHTDRSGTRYRILETGSTPPTPTGEATLAIEWQRTGGSANVCQKLMILTNGKYTLQDCRPDAQSASEVEGSLSGQDLKAVTTLLGQFSQFSANLKSVTASGETFTDDFTLYGTGSGVAGDTEKEAVHRLLEEIASHIVANPADGGDSATSGVQVQALIGPNCPGPVSADTPCPDKPYQASFSVLSASNAPVTQFQTDSQGQFKLDLPPGKYVLHPELTGRYPMASDQPFTVEAGSYTRIEVTFDTGIR